LVFKIYGCFGVLAAGIQLTDFGFDIELLGHNFAELGSLQ
jgi:hypothetical protein